MNALTLALISLGFLYAGYRIYGKLISRLWDLNPNRPTPAHVKRDSTDYIPAKHWSVLFGHHFASIAGAAPIIGPVLAVYYWGWAGGFLWILLGSVFLGAVHDFSSLIASIRNGGQSVAAICRDTLGRKANVIFSVFLWLALVFVVAVFAAVGAGTLVSKPEVVLPALGIIPVAVLVGFLIYRAGVSQVIATVIGIILLGALLIGGNYYPITISGWTDNPQTVWMIILLLYAFVASVLPVNILLQPRDYISTFLLFFGLFFGYLGIVISNPSLSSPAFAGASHPVGGPLWPMLFVTIACGAISGFHSVVASGTTSKQLASEKNAPIIGYGGMLAEGALAVLALIAVAAGLKVGVYSEIMMAEEAPIKAFAIGYGNLTRPLFGNYGILIAVTVLNAFIITTLDTATRISRYLTEELFSLKNKYLSTTIIIGFAFYLALGSWKKIWPIFGASNQLVATLALLVLSAYLLSKKRKTLYTVIPAIIMFFTSGGALLWQLNKFIKDGNYILTFITGLLFLLALYMAFLTLNYFIKERKGKTTNSG